MKSHCSLSQEKGIRKNVQRFFCKLNFTILEKIKKINLFWNVMDNEIWLNFILFLFRGF